MSSWRIRFHDKWPHMSSLYSGGSAREDEEHAQKYVDPMMMFDNVYEDPAEPYGAYKFYMAPREEFVIQSEPHLYPTRAVYKDDDDRTSGYATSGGSSSFKDGSTRRILLCVLLIFLLIGAIIAAVTMAVLISHQRRMKPLSPDSQQQDVLESNIRIANRTYIAAHGDPNSKEFKILETEFCEAIDAMFLRSDSPLNDDYKGCKVLSFRYGSVIARYLLRFSWKDKKPTGPVVDTVRDFLQDTIPKIGIWNPLLLDGESVNIYPVEINEFEPSRKSPEIKLTSDNTDREVVSSSVVSVIDSVSGAASVQINDISTLGVPSEVTKKDSSSGLSLTTRSAKSEEVYPTSKLNDNVGKLYPSQSYVMVESEIAPSVSLSSKFSKHAFDILLTKSDDIVEHLLDGMEIQKTPSVNTDATASLDKSASSDITLQSDEVDRTPSGVLPPVLPSSKVSSGVLSSFETLHPDLKISATPSVSVINIGTDVSRPLHATSLNTNFASMDVTSPTDDLFGRFLLPSSPSTRNPLGFPWYESKNVHQSSVDDLFANGGFGGFLFPFPMGKESSTEILPPNYMMTSAHSQFIPYSYSMSDAEMNQHMDRGHQSSLESAISSLPVYNLKDSTEDAAVRSVDLISPSNEFERHSSPTLGPEIDGMFNNFILQSSSLNQEAAEKSPSTELIESDTSSEYNDHFSSQILSNDRYTDTTSMLSSTQGISSQSPLHAEETFKELHSPSFQSTLSTSSESLISFQSAIMSPSQVLTSRDIAESSLYEEPSSPVPSDDTLDSLMSSSLGKLPLHVQIADDSSLFSSFPSTSDIIPLQSTTSSYNSLQALLPGDSGSELPIEEFGLYSNSLPLLENRLKSVIVDRSTEGVEDSQMSVHSTKIDSMTQPHDAISSFSGIIPDISLDGKLESIFDNIYNMKDVASPIVSTAISSSLVEEHKTPDNLKQTLQTSHTASIIQHSSAMDLSFYKSKDTITKSFSDVLGDVSDPLSTLAQKDKQLTDTLQNSDSLTKETSSSLTKVSMTPSSLNNGLKSTSALTDEKYIISPTKSLELGTEIVISSQSALLEDASISSNLNLNAKDTMEVAQILDTVSTPSSVQHVQSTAILSDTTASEIQSSSDFSSRSPYTMNSVISSLQLGSITTSDLESQSSFSFPGLSQTFDEQFSDTKFQNTLDKFYSTALERIDHSTLLQTSQTQSTSDFESTIHVFASTIVTDSDIVHTLKSLQTKISEKYQSSTFEAQHLLSSSDDQSSKFDLMPSNIRTTDMKSESMYIHTMLNDSSRPVQLGSDITSTAVIMDTTPVLDELNILSNGISASPTFGSVSTQTYLPRSINPESSHADEQTKVLAVSDETDNPNSTWSGSYIDKSSTTVTLSSNLDSKSIDLVSITPDVSEHGINEYEKMVPSITAAFLSTEEKLSTDFDLLSSMPSQFETLSAQSISSETLTQTVEALGYFSASGLMTESHIDTANDVDLNSQIVPQRTTDTLLLQSDTASPAVSENEFNTETRVLDSLSTSTRTSKLLTNVQDLQPSKLPSSDVSSDHSIEFSNSVFLDTDSLVVKNDSLTTALMDIITSTPIDTLPIIVQSSDLTTTSSSYFVSKSILDNINGSEPQETKFQSSSPRLVTSIYDFSNSSVGHLYDEMQINGLLSTSSLYTTSEVHDVLSATPAGTVHENQTTVESSSLHAISSSIDALFLSKTPEISENILETINVIDSFRSNTVVPSEMSSEVSTSFALVGSLSSLPHADNERTATEGVDLFSLSTTYIYSHESVSLESGLAPSPTDMPYATEILTTAAFSLNSEIWRSDGDIKSETSYPSSVSYIPPIINQHTFSASNIDQSTIPTSIHSSLTVTTHPVTNVLTALASSSPELLINTSTSILFPSPHPSSKYDPSLIDTLPITSNQVFPENDSSILTTDSKINVTQSQIDISIETSYIENSSYFDTASKIQNETFSSTFNISDDIHVMNSVEHSVSNTPLIDIYSSMPSFETISILKSSRTFSSITSSEENKSQNVHSPDVLLDSFSLNSTLMSNTSEFPILSSSLLEFDTLIDDLITNVRSTSASIAALQTPVGVEFGASSTLVSDIQSLTPLVTPYNMSIDSPLESSQINASHDLDPHAFEPNRTETSISPTHVQSYSLTVVSSVEQNQTVFVHDTSENEFKDSLYYANEISHSLSKGPQTIDTVDSIIPTRVNSQTSYIGTEIQYQTSNPLITSQSILLQEELSTINPQILNSETTNLITRPVSPSQVNSYSSSLIASSVLPPGQISSYFSTNTFISDVKKEINSLDSGALVFDDAVTNLVSPTLVESEITSNVPYQAIDDNSTIPISQTFAEPYMPSAMSSEILSQMSSLTDTSYDPSHDASFDMNTENITHSSSNLISPTLVESYVSSLIANDILSQAPSLPNTSNDTFHDALSDINKENSPLETSPLATEDNSTSLISPTLVESYMSSLIANEILSSTPSLLNTSYDTSYGLLSDVNTENSTLEIDPREIDYNSTILTSQTLVESFMPSVMANEIMSPVSYLLNNSTNLISPTLVESFMPSSLANNILSQTPPLMNTSYDSSLDVLLDMNTESNTHDSSNLISPTLVESYMPSLMTNEIMSQTPSLINTSNNISHDVLSSMNIENSTLEIGPQAIDDNSASLISPMLVESYMPSVVAEKILSPTPSLLNTSYDISSDVLFDVSKENSTLEIGPLTIEDNSTSLISQTFVESYMPSIMSNEIMSSMSSLENSSYDTSHDVLSDKNTENSTLELGPLAIDDNSTSLISPTVVESYLPSVVTNDILSQTAYLLNTLYNTSHDFLLHVNNETRSFDMSPLTFDDNSTNLISPTLVGSYISSFMTNITLSQTPYLASTSYNISHDSLFDMHKEIGTLEIGPQASDDNSMLLSSPTLVGTHVPSVMSNEILSRTFSAHALTSDNSHDFSYKKGSLDINSTAFDDMSTNLSSPTSVELYASSTITNEILAPTSSVFASSDSSRDFLFDIDRVNNSDASLKSVENNNTSTIKPTLLTSANTQSHSLSMENITFSSDQSTSYFMSEDIPVKQNEVLDTSNLMSDNTSPSLIQSDFFSKIQPEQTLSHDASIYNAVKENNSLDIGSRAFHDNITYINTIQPTRVESYSSPLMSSETLSRTPLLQTTSYDTMIDSPFTVNNESLTRDLGVEMLHSDVAKSITSVNLPTVVNMYASSVTTSEIPSLIPPLDATSYDNLNDTLNSKDIESHSLHSDPQIFSMNTTRNETMTDVLPTLVDSVISSAVISEIPTEEKNTLHLVPEAFDLSTSTNSYPTTDNVSPTQVDSNLPSVGTGEIQSQLPLVQTTPYDASKDFLFNFNDESPSLNLDSQALDASTFDTSINSTQYFLRSSLFFTSVEESSLHDLPIQSSSYESSSTVQIYNDMASSIQNENQKELLTSKSESVMDSFELFGSLSGSVSDSFPVTNILPNLNVTHVTNILPTYSIKPFDTVWASYGASSLDPGTISPITNSTDLTHLTSPLGHSSQIPVTSDSVLLSTGALYPKNESDPFLQKVVGGHGFSNFNLSEIDKQDYYKAVNESDFFVYPASGKKENVSINANRPSQSRIYSPAVDLNENFMRSEILRPLNEYDHLSPHEHFGEDSYMEISLSLDSLTQLSIDIGTDWASGVTSSKPYTEMQTLLPSIKPFPHSDGSLQISNTAFQTRFETDIPMETVLNIGSNSKVIATPVSQMSSKFSSEISFSTEMQKNYSSERKFDGPFSYVVDSDHTTKPDNIALNITRTTRMPSVKGTAFSTLDISSSMDYGIKVSAVSTTPIDSSLMHNSNKHLINSKSSEVGSFKQSSEVAYDASVGNSLAISSVERGGGTGSFTNGAFALHTQTLSTSLENSARFNSPSQENKNWESRPVPTKSSTLNQGILSNHLGSVSELSLNRPSPYLASSVSINIENVALLSSSSENSVSNAYPTQLLDFVNSLNSVYYTHTSSVGFIGNKVIDDILLLSSVVSENFQDTRGMLTSSIFTDLDTMVQSLSMEKPIKVGNSELIHSSKIANVSTLSQNGDRNDSTSKLGNDLLAGIVSAPLNRTTEAQRTNTISENQVSSTSTDKKLVNFTSDVVQSSAGNYTTKSPIEHNTNIKHLQNETSKAAQKFPPSIKSYTETKSGSSVDTFLFTAANDYEYYATAYDYITDNSDVTLSDSVESSSASSSLTALDDTKFYNNPPPLIPIQPTAISSRKANEAKLDDALSFESAAVEGYPIRLELIKPNKTQSQSQISSNLNSISSETSNQNNFIVSSQGFLETPARIHSSQATQIMKDTTMSSLRGLPRIPLGTMIKESPTSSIIPMSFDDPFAAFFGSGPAIPQWVLDMLGSVHESPKSSANYHFRH